MVWFDEENEYRVCSQINRQTGVKIWLSLYFEQSQA